MRVRLRLWAWLTDAGQTFEGGISGQPNAEAHGAYAFCALGCLALLDHPGRSISRCVHGICTVQGPPIPPSPHPWQKSAAY
jgi:hypothetical protein